MALELTLYPDPVLKKRAPAVERIDAALRDRVRDMFEVMYKEHGIGLAAPQVSWSTRLFVINVSGEPDEGEELVFINPQIVASSKDEELDEEGCLSIPDIRGEVARSLKVRVKAQDLDGKWFELETEELLARAIQHELDHIDGILFIQRLSPADQLAVKKQLKKLEKQSPGSSSTSARR
jgi:peptide deformylase